MTNQMLSADLTRIASEFELDLQHVAAPPDKGEGVYYPQFPARIRAEAHRMARHYELFYCLERFIRELVDQSLTDSKKTDDWWATECVPSHIRAEVAGRIKTEVDAGVSRRSNDELDFTTFGELAVIITANWEVFGASLSSKKAVEKVMASLNSLRNPIAHCCPLAEDEELRLSLALRDWFRLME
jgi:hypothetical protein